jgi:hypothetical protein
LDHTIELWGAATEDETRILGTHPLRVFSAAYNSDGSRLASGSDGNTIKLWDVKTGIEIRTLRGDQLREWITLASPDRSRLDSDTVDNLIGRRAQASKTVPSEVNSGEETRTRSEDDDCSSKVYFSPDGNRLYAADFYGNKSVWNCENGERLPNEEWVRPALLRNTSPDGRWLVTSSGNQVLLVDLQYKNTPAEKAFRKYKARLDPRWHREQAALAEATADWYAATFHWAWVMKADPTSEAAYDALHAAHEKWRSQFPVSDVDGGLGTASKEGQESDETNEPTQQGAEPKQTQPDLLLAPMVREMLAIPRGSIK